MGEKSSRRYRANTLTTRVTRKRGVAESGVNNVEVNAQFPQPGERDLGDNHVQLNLTELINHQQIDNPRLASFLSPPVHIRQVGFLDKGYLPASGKGRPSWGKNRGRRCD